MSFDFFRNVKIIKILPKVMLSIDGAFLAPYKEVKNIKETSTIANIEYTINGNLFSYTTNDTLKIFSSEKANVVNVISTQIDSMKYFQENTLIHSKDSTLFYLSIYDNKYLMKFESHSSQILDISTDPDADQFMSVSSDCINIWDIRMQSPSKKIITSNSVAAIGHEYEYCIVDNSLIKIFDRREDYGPINVKMIPSNIYKKAWYSADANYICLLGSNEYTFLDRTGASVSFVSVEKENEGDITNDSRNLLCCSGKYIFAYRIKDRRKIGMIETPSIDNYYIKSNPSFSQFLCASKDCIRIYTSS